MVQETNQYNDPPEEGMEYVIIKARVRYIGTEDETMNMNAFDFQTTGSEGVLYGVPAVVDPRPVLDVSLYPGGEYEGWMVMQVGEDEGNIVLIFDAMYDFFEENKRFLSLGE